MSIHRDARVQSERRACSFPGDVFIRSNYQVLSRVMRKFASVTRRKRFVVRRTGLRHVRLGCRTAVGWASVKGGEATCEALDGRPPDCYLRQVCLGRIGRFAIHLLQRLHAHISLNAPLSAGYVTPQAGADKHQCRLNKGVCGLCLRALVSVLFRIRQLFG